MVRPSTLSGSSAVVLPGVSRSNCSGACTVYHRFCCLRLETLRSLMVGLCWIGRKLCCDAEVDDVVVDGRLEAARGLARYLCDHRLALDAGGHLGGVVRADGRGDAFGVGRRTVAGP